MIRERAGHLVRRYLQIQTTVLALAGAVGNPGTLHAQAAATHADPERVVRAFLDAYNRHDVPGLLALSDTEIVWLSVEGDSVRVETRGREALARGLEGYFRRLPSVRSTLERVSALGPWVSAHERAEWTAASGARSQSAVSVYEVRERRIRRVWYYPAVR